MNLYGFASPTSNRQNVRIYLVTLRDVIPADLDSNPPALLNPWMSNPQTRRTEVRNHPVDTIRSGRPREVKPTLRPLRLDLVNMVLRLGLDPKPPVLGTAITNPSINDTRDSTAPALDVQLPLYAKNITCPCRLRNTPAQPRVFSATPCLFVDLHSVVLRFAALRSVFLHSLVSSSPSSSAKANSPSTPAKPLPFSSPSPQPLDTSLQLSQSQ
jgi:hypothetical protein